MAASKGVAAPNPSTLAPANAEAAVAQSSVRVALPAISLKEVLARALEGNPDLLRARATIEGAAGAIVAAEGQFDVLVTGGAVGARRATPAVTSTDLTSGVTRTLTLDLGIARALESGGRLSLAAQQIALESSSRTQCGLGSLNDPVSCRVYSNSLGLTFTQPLLRGFGQEITLMTLRQARIQKDIDLLNRQASAAVVVRDVVTAYWELAYAADDRDIRESAVRLAEQQRKSTQALVDVGRLGRADLAAVDRAIADRLQEVATAEQSWVGRGLDIQRLAGQQVAPNFLPPAAAEHAEVSSVDIDAPAETERALAANPELKALRSGQQISEFELQRSAALLRPQLDFAGTIASVGRRKDDLAESWAQVGRFDAVNASAGLTFQWPLQNRAARGVETTARAATDRTRIDTRAMELAIRESVVRFAAALRATTRKNQLARDAVRYAQINLDAEQARFDVGRSTNNDVLLRQQELKLAQIQVLRAATDAAIAEAALAAVTGDILDRYQIRLRGL